MDKFYPQGPNPVLRSYPGGTWQLQDPCSVGSLQAFVNDASGTFFKALLSLLQPQTRTQLRRACRVKNCPLFKDWCLNPIMTKILIRIWKLYHYNSNNLKKQFLRNFLIPIGIDLRKCWTFYYSFDNILLWITIIVLSQEGHLRL